MNIRFHVGSIAGFFNDKRTAHNLYWFARSRLFLSRLFCVHVLLGRVRGGVAYWRGNVLPGSVFEQGGGGVNAQQGGGSDSGLFRQTAALFRLAVGLSAHSKGGGALRGAGVNGGKGGKKAGHGLSPLHKARKLVIAGPAWGRYEKPSYLRQRVIDGYGLHKQKITGGLFVRGAA